MNYTFEYRIYDEVENSLYYVSTILCPELTCISFRIRWKFLIKHLKTYERGLLVKVPQN